ncbi:hypothetical protein KIN20_024629 [Parelaphostrongylus tenuis]|uniref:G-protein coupled receptors family 1 profile domain-containing protein n=1 Tax=Parelaphostrongylus tenuis TaxID=148309 RepID=A0AAD5MX82_PARTN|nr:hypothetical protein KIN20_024629 [Parelaphostrongylus tenuis]
MGALLITIFWVAPTTLLECEISTELASKVLGILDIIFWNVGIYCHLAISLNRVVAITFPLQVSNFLSVRNTAVAVLICWMLGVLLRVPYVWANCFFFYNTVKWEWRFSETPCIFVLINFHITQAVIILIVVLDCITLICLRIKHKGNKTQYHNGIYTNIAARKRKEMEVRFVKQVKR